MAIMNKMLLVVALLVAIVVSAMGLLEAPDPFPFPLPEGCIGLKCRKGT